ncbi:CocE/NonD family hydrolase [Nocardia higoensis]|nr:CocE/NonD family hydrolase [Nocardia higoensis]
MKRTLRRRSSAASTVLLAATMIVALAGMPASAAPDGGADGARWLSDYEAPPKYPDVHIEWDVPLTMSDGTVLKANVYRPADARGPIAEKTPTIVNITPYTKLFQMLIDSAIATPALYDALNRLLKLADFSAVGMGGLSDMAQNIPAGVGRIFAGVDRKLIQSGYSVAVVDARGTGFSQGVWDVLGEREQLDAAEIVDWAGSQPWSTGDVGMTGASYCAINQLHAAQKGAKALKAIFPVDAGNDLSHDIINTGGGFGVGFLVPWITFVNTTKALPDIISMLTGSFDWKWLEDRVSSPFTMADALLGYFFSATWELMPASTQNVWQSSSDRHKAWLGSGVDNVEVPTFMVGSWFDLFAYSEIKAFEQIPLSSDKKKLMMGNGYHITPLGRHGEPGTPPRLDVLQRAWFDRWLKGIDNGIDRYDPITLFQQGGGWTSVDTFPRPDAVHRRLYLSAAPSGTTSFPVAHDGSLTAEPPTESRRLTVTPGLATVCSRDSAQITAGITSVFDICAKDSRVAETSALTFTSPPVDAPTTISGPIALHLNTVHDTTDGFWTATVNDVAPDGTSTAITSGQLVSSIRMIDEGKSTRSANGDYTDPYPTLAIEDRLPVVPGQPTVLDISMRATDAILKPGHRLRIDVFASNFPRAVPSGPTLVDSELAPQHLQLDPQAPSYVNIPVGGNPRW